MIPCWMDICPKFSSQWYFLGMVGFLMDFPQSCFFHILGYFEIHIFFYFRALNHNFWTKTVKIYSKMTKLWHILARIYKKWAKYWLAEGSSLILADPEPTQTPIWPSEPDGRIIFSELSWTDIWAYMSWNLVEANDTFKTWLF